MMTENVTTSTDKEPCSQLRIGAFTFVREKTGRIVLNVDADSGLYPLRLTNEQTYMLTQWFHTFQEDTAWS